jgi:hypothetical protein
MHQTAGNVLQILLDFNPQQNLTQARNIVNQSLATGMHSMQVTVATTLSSKPGALAFSCVVADWQSIVQHRKQYVNENLCHANGK